MDREELNKLTEKELNDVMYEVCDSLNVPLTHEESELIAHYSKAIIRRLKDMCNTPCQHSHD